MTDPIESTQSTAASQQTQQVESSTTPAASGQPTSLTTVNSMEELKTKAPEVYNKMLEGIATQIVNKMRRHQDNLKALMREGRRNSGQG